MRKQSSAAALYVAALSVGITAAAPASAQDALGYQDAMRCGGLYTFFSAMNEEEQNDEMATAMSEHAQRWLVMAMVRDEHDGTKALAEFELVTETLLAKLEDLDEAEVEPFLLGHMEKCDRFEEANSAEFNAIVLD